MGKAISKLVGFDFPLRGRDDNWSYAQQPPGTTPRATNVLPYDRAGRDRGGVRPGTTKLYAAQVSGAHAVPGLCQLEFQDASGVYQVRVVAVSNLLVKYGSLASLSAPATNTATALTGTKPQMAVLNGHVYLVDGGPAVRDLDPVADSLTDLTCNCPDGNTVPQNCRLICTWRGRLVLAGQASDPQNFFASRQLRPDDWDYAQIDEAGAFAGNASALGRIGEPVTCLMPLSDDLLVLGGDHSIWLVRGDPKAGGSIDKISTTVGVVGPDCYCEAPGIGWLFVGTGGLYRLLPSGMLDQKPISGGRRDQFFAAIDRSVHEVTVRWDRERHGAWIFVQRSDGTGQAKVLFWDARNDSFWDQQFPSGHGPRAAIVYDGPGATDRFLLLGGQDGYVRKLDAAAISDDGATIVAEVMLGPVEPAGPMRQGKLNGIQFNMAELPAGISSGNWSMSWTLQCGQDHKAALDAPAQSSGGTITGNGYRGNVGLRMAGAVYFLRLYSSGSTWAVERITGVFEPAGRKR